MNTMPSPPPAPWQRLGERLISAFHAYASWLVGISWKRFFLLALLLLVASGISKELLTIKIHPSPEASTVRKAPRPTRSESPTPPGERTRKDSDGESADGVDISIDHRGIRVTKRPGSSASASASASAAASSASAASSSTTLVIAHDDMSEAMKALREEIRTALREAIQELRDVHIKDQEAEDEPAAHGPRELSFSLGGFLPDLAMLWIVASIIIKITYKGELQARADAARANRVAESEQIKRQAAEARVAAVSAQVEPHFLFNTLASIDHLIETDPPRASRMQKSLIALLRATLPSLREDSALGGVRTLGQEADVIIPYLDIMKVRMEDRLQAEVDIPDGLRSAQFPPLMLQGLVENAIKHGLEPKAEGGRLSVKAHIVDGVLALSVRDTGVGLPSSDTASSAKTSGTGTGLANIRERLQLLYGPQAQLVLSSPPEGGTLATLTLPYQVQTAATSRQGSTA
jgi:signal transduction histidine kinase